MKTELEGTQEQINTTDNDKKSRREREVKFQNPEKIKKTVNICETIKISKIDKEDPTHENRSPRSRKSRGRDQTSTNNYNSREYLPITKI